MRATVVSIKNFVNYRGDSENMTVISEQGNTGVRVLLYSEGESVAVDITAEEMDQLITTLESNKSVLRLSLGGDNGENLGITPINWGDPYEDGVSFTLRNSNDFYGSNTIGVSLTQYVCSDLLEYLKSIVKNNTSYGL